MSSVPQRCDLAQRVQNKAFSGERWGRIFLLRIVCPFATAQTFCASQDGLRTMPTFCDYKRKEDLSAGGLLKFKKTRYLY